MMEKEKYCYSFNGENYYGTFDTEDEAIDEAKSECRDQDFVYIGTCTKPILRWCSNEEYIIESIGEQLSDEVGEYAENFEVSIEQERELARMIDETVKAWIDKEKIEPQCYAVLDGHIVELKEEEKNDEN